MIFADIRNEWNSFAINDLSDSYYQEWTYEDRKYLEYTCQSGFLFSVVVVQWVAAIQCRSRKLSMVQRLWNNHCLTFALIFETFLASALIYLPGNSDVRPSNIILLFLLDSLMCFHFRDSISPPSPAYTGGCLGWPSRSFFSATRSSGRRYPGSTPGPGWRKRQDTELLSIYSFDDFPVNLRPSHNLKIIHKEHQHYVKICPYFLMIL